MKHFVTKSVSPLFLLLLIQVCKCMSLEESWSFWPHLPSSVSYQGEENPSNPSSDVTPANEVINIFYLPKPSSKLLYGGVLNSLSVVPSSSPCLDAVMKFVCLELKQLQCTQLHILQAKKAQLDCTSDNGRSQRIVSFQYETYSGHLQTFRSHINFGINFYVTFAPQDHLSIQHNVAVSLDRNGAYNLFQHTSNAPQKSNVQQEKTCMDDVCTGKTGGIRVLTYNVWNVNPPHYIIRFNRWTHYVKRINHLVKFIQQANADIVGLQEVRYDSTFGGVDNHAQIQHFRKRLPEFQHFVYQAAMTYVNPNDPLERIEEGPAILSRYPIVYTDYLLLSRLDVNDPNDSHQRICLHAVVDIPHWGKVDIYTAHLSLSEKARENSLVEIWKFIKEKGKGDTQILLGDLNAEPQSKGIQFLQGKMKLQNHLTDFKDAFLQVSSEPNPRSKIKVDIDKKFTFPSDNPVKRIDYLFYRGKGKVSQCDVIGQDPTDDTKHLVRDDYNVGMLDKESPTYASDHRGVIMELG